jgi:hypothetical protein
VVPGFVPAAYQTLADLLLDFRHGQNTQEQRIVGRDSCARRPYHQAILVRDMKPAIYFNWWSRFNAQAGARVTEIVAYRHALELYLKIIGEIDEHTHSLKECIRLLEKRHGERIPSPAREWIIELDEIDPAGTAFRYADEQVGTMKSEEYWMDFVQFKFAMALVFKMLDFAVLDGGRTVNCARAQSHAGACAVH